MSDHCTDLVDFVAASPSSFHAARTVAGRLIAAGFAAVDETLPFEAAPGGYVLVRDGAVLAWRIPEGATATTPFHVVGAHTDSPGLKPKPQPTTAGNGWRQVAVEVYGGPLLNSWLDRDLGLAGRLVGRDGTEHLVATGPVMRVPQLAIHLDRQVNDGLTLNKQTHLQPVWGIQAGGVLAHLAELAGLDPDDVAGHDLISFDTQRGARIGAAEEFLACGRLDNLSSVHAGLTALEAATDTDVIAVLAAFDHEEVGSESRSGASGPVLADVLLGISTALGGGPDQLRRALAASWCVSADAGHAVHPNYPERHDPTHRPMPNGGPLLKVNANQRYASDGAGAALWSRACDAAGVPTQVFVSNNALPCGSTIGPLTATRLGLRTVDVGIALLSMHSARELCGADDPGYLAAALREFYRQVG
ncbi:M18 family aminopeptidase [Cumulibacter manganitolerans]|uniref:M18 family aminopeptidase n=1 Tax=Cumulibacter manganitolerans TaxID=1884992 RepID=UPI0012974979|nr:M18 family aminopeptidase [Cumulibacter manganitolerans]